MPKENISTNQFKNRKSQLVYNALNVSKMNLILAVQLVGLETGKSGNQAEGANCFDKNKNKIKHMH